MNANKKLQFYFFCPGKTVLRLSRRIKLISSRDAEKSRIRPHSFMITRRRPIQIPLVPLCSNGNRRIKQFRSPERSLTWYSLSVYPKQFSNETKFRQFFILNMKKRLARIPYFVPFSSCLSFLRIRLIHVIRRDPCVLFPYDFFFQNQKNIIFLFRTKSRNP